MARLGVLPYLVAAIAQGLEQIAIEISVDGTG
jgi:hypothetical protein